MISSSSSWKVRRQASNSLSACASCSARRRLRIVRVVEDQAFDAVPGRPFAQRAADVRAALEAQRDRARQLDRAADPERLAARLVERVAAEPVVEQDAAVGPAAGGLARRLEAEPLEVRDVLVGDAGAHPPSARAGRGGRTPSPAAAARPWCGWSPNAPARASRPSSARARGEPWAKKYSSSVKLGTAGAQPWRETANAPQALAYLQAVLERRVAQIAAQEAAHEGVAGAQDVEHLDREARPLDAVLEVGRDRPVEHDAAHRAALDHDQRRPARARGSCGRRRACRWCRRRCGSPPRCRRSRRSPAGWSAGGPRRSRRDEALLAEAMAGQAPQHRAVVDVEDHPAAMLPGEAHRLLAHGIEVGLGEVGAGDHDRARGCDVVLGRRRPRSAPRRRSSRARRSTGRSWRSRMPRITSAVSRPGRS